MTTRNSESISRRRRVFATTVCLTLLATAAGASRMNRHHVARPDNSPRAMVMWDRFLSGDLVEPPAAPRSRRSYYIRHTVQPGAVPLGAFVANQTLNSRTQWDEHFRASVPQEQRPATPPASMVSRLAQDPNAPWAYDPLPQHYGIPLQGATPR